MKKFFKPMDKNGEEFLYLKTIFSKLSDAKRNECIFIGPEINLLVKNKISDIKLNGEELCTQTSLKAMLEGFLQKHRAENVELLVNYL